MTLEDHGSENPSRTSVDSAGSDTSNGILKSLCTPGKAVAAGFRELDRDSRTTRKSSKAASSTTSFHPWRSGPSEPYHSPLNSDGNPWGNCFNLVRTVDDEMCRAWREEVDTLLVFAGLFSAAVTAFTVESYRWLQDDAEDTTNLLLIQISKQLSILDTNSTIPQSISLPGGTFEGSAAAVRINVLWFTSLTLALTAVLVGILCKQWLREYQRYESLSPRDAFPVRQMRFEGLNGWHVPKVLSSLPLLLQAALVLFFAGLLDLLWSLNPVVASVASVVAGLAMLLLIATTALPTFQYLFHFTGLKPADEPAIQCAYKSPQSWAFHLFVTWLVCLVSRLQSRIMGVGTMANYLQGPSWVPDSNWVKYDLRWQTHGKYTERALEWTNQTFKRHVDAIRSIYHCLESMDNEMAARCVAKRVEDTMDPVVPLTGMLVPTLRHHETLDQDEPVYSTAKELILMSYLLMHHTADRELAMRCVEQCVRIGNSEADIPKSTAIVLEVLGIVLSWLPVRDDLHEQLLAMLKSLLARNKINDSNLANYWKVLGFLCSDNEAPASGLVEDIMDWLQQSVDTHVPIHEKISRVRLCLEGVAALHQKNVMDVQLSLEDSSITVRPTFMGSEMQRMLGIMDSIDKQLEGLPANTPLTSPWTTDSWVYAKQSFLFAVGEDVVSTIP